MAVFVVTTPAKADPEAGAAAPVSEPAKTGSDHWTLGVGAAVTPEFQGSDTYKVDPVPLVDVQYGRFFAKVGEGVGFNVIDTPGFRAGVGVNWMQGYDDDDTPDGIEGADDALGARIFMSARYEGAVFTVAATQAVTESDRGLLVNGSLAYPIHATERLAITPSAGVSWGNKTYMDSYFGVDAAEASASGLAFHEPSNGFKDVYFRVSASYRLTDSISALGSFGVTQLVGDAADSPFVEQTTQPLGLMGLAYTF